ncbi:PREDICTED: toll/interleukin-1 receptor-like protein [Tarenaya hassleriana]|uniref:toll/interleukin-1 receptor-like protein n=1 Tax=Tarenaya hassleriana TaxID=28532 RepID=UPI0008FD2ED4|nr:PREDICTED: toll/interleukin-1 receptor-like protein [Tarenaya hassleriana]
MALALFFFFFFFILFVLAFFLSCCWNHIAVLDRTPTSASASCPSCFDSGFRYDVFISFRGPDTRNGFTSHLFYALRRANIRTFMDHELEKGEEISRGLFDAIERSKILVVVLSENYASSTWCLDELAKIMECRRRGHKVLPVFYGVKPVEVRRQTGRYEAALAMHQNGSREKGMTEKVKRWRDALTEGASLFGYDSDVVSPDGKLVNDIVDDILEMLQNSSITRPTSHVNFVGTTTLRSEDYSQ